MEIIGGGKVFVFPEADEMPHEPGPEENWQESFVLIWYDPTTSVGGLLRIGHEPNHAGGVSQIFCNVVSPAGVFRRTAHLPLEPRHRLPNGVISGDDSMRYEYRDGRMFWSVDCEDVELKLEVDPFVPAIDAQRRDTSEGAQKYLGAHIDAGCSVSGVVKVKGQSYVLQNALAMRDHGWGSRAWYDLLAHRWVSGTFDRENSFVAMSFLTAGNANAKRGWVIRGDQVLLAENVDIKAIIGMDGSTNFGGVLTMTLTTGEIFSVKFEPYHPSLASWVRTTSVFDSLCRTTWGDKVGFGVFETSCNSQAGTRRPEVYEGSYSDSESGEWHEPQPLLAGR